MYHKDSWLAPHGSLQASFVLGHELPSSPQRPLGGWWGHSVVKKNPVTPVGELENFELIGVCVCVLLEYLPPQGCEGDARENVTLLSKKAFFWGGTFGDILSG